MALQGVDNDVQDAVHSLWITDLITLVIGDEHRKTNCMQGQRVVAMVCRPSVDNGRSTTPVWDLGNLDVS
jgi:hypothetical protein